MQGSVSSRTKFRSRSSGHVIGHLLWFQKYDAITDSTFPLNAIRRCEIEREEILKRGEWHGHWQGREKRGAPSRRKSWLGRDTATRGHGLAYFHFLPTWSRAFHRRKERKDDSNYNPKSSKDNRFMTLATPIYPSTSPRWPKLLVVYEVRELHRQFCRVPWPFCMLVRGRVVLLCPGRNRQIVIDRYCFRGRVGSITLYDHCWWGWFSLIWDGWRTWCSHVE